MAGRITFQRTGETKRKPVHTNDVLSARAEGQVLILFALMSLVLVGFMALSIDVGYLVSERRQVQSAADAAAMAGAQSLLLDKTGEVTPSAREYGAVNAGVAEGDVQVSTDASCIDVSIPKDVERYFLGAIYTGAWEVAASARACIEDTPGNYALITLDEDTEPGIRLNGGPGGGPRGIKITGKDAGAMSNSTIDGTNNSVFEVEGSIDAHKSINAGQNWVAPDGIRPGSRVIEDPLEDVEPPDRPGTERDQDYIDSCLEDDDCTLDPGIYSGVDIGLGNNQSVTLNPGLYYFENSDISLKNNSVFQSRKSNPSDGVKLYFTGSSTFDPKNGNVDLRAPEPAGPSPADHIVTWFDECTDVDLQGNGKMHFRGIFYAPCSNVLLHGNPNNETIVGQIIVGTADIRGTSLFGIDYYEHVETKRPAVFLVE